MEEMSVLFARLRAGERDAREVLIEKNLGLVRHIAKRFWGRGVEPDDLFQIGTIGLIKAIDKFDCSLGLQFSTYAVPLIMGEIRRFLRDDGPVKVSRSIKENSARLAAVREKISGETGRMPHLEELAKASGLSKEETILAMEADSVVESLEGNRIWEDGSTQPLMDRVVGDAEGGFCASTCPGTRDAEKEKLLDRMLLGQLMDGLSEEERKLLCLRYYRDRTQTEIAQIMGISQVQVSRREKKILERLRREVIS